MGDKTQLLALLLTTRFKKPWTILLGIFVATLLNHGLASWFGEVLAGLIPDSTLNLILSALFFAFAFWVLIPDKEEELKEKGHWGALFTTVVAFFLAEMGDKTQLATVALGATYTNVYLVTLGSTLGMLASNALAVFFGHRLLALIPMKWVRRTAALLFALFGVLLLWRALL